MFKSKQIFLVVAIVGLAIGFATNHVIAVRKLQARLIKTASEEAAFAVSREFLTAKQFKDWRVLVLGKVDSINGNTLNIKTKEGYQAAVILTDQTRFQNDADISLDEWPTISRSEIVPGKEVVASVIIKNNIPQAETVTLHLPINLPTDQ